MIYINEIETRPFLCEMDVDYKSNMLGIRIYEVVEEIENELRGVISGETITEEVEPPTEFSNDKVTKFNSYVKGTHIKSGLKGLFRETSTRLINFNDERIKNESSDYGLWISYWVNGVLQNIFNSTPLTYSAKIKPEFLGKWLQHSVILTILQPFIDSELKECNVVVAINPEYGLICNEKFLPLEENLLEKTYPKIVPSDEIVTIDSNEILEIPVHLYDHEGNIINKNMEIFLEETGGYLPLKRIYLNNGTGKLVVHALSNSPGDEFKIKLGTKYYSGVNEINFKVM